jgi:hypothetical protein
MNIHFASDDKKAVSDPTYSNNTSTAANPKRKQTPDDFKLE